MSPFRLFSDRWYLGVALFWCMVWIIPASITLATGIPSSNTVRTFLLLSNFLQLPMVLLLVIGVATMIQNTKSDLMENRRQVRDDLLQNRGSVKDDLLENRGSVKDDLLGNRGSVKGDLLENRGSVKDDLLGNRGSVKDDLLGNRDHIEERIDELLP